MSFSEDNYKSVRSSRSGCYGHGGCRGFRLSSRPRFYVHRIRTRFLNLFKVLRRLKTSYLRALRSLRRHMNNNGEKTKNHCRHHRYHHQYGCDYRMKSFGRSNSFYSEAIADCLDFIKRNSVSLEEEEKPVLITTQS